jgi:hypothetical protein
MKIEMGNIIRYIKTRYTSNPHMEPPTDNNICELGVSMSGEINTCLICWEKVDEKKWASCTKCNVLLHDTCELLYRGTKTYSECPHCLRIGTIDLFGTEVNVPTNFDKLLKFIGEDVS